MGELFDVATGRELLRHDEPNEFNFSADGKLMVTQSGLFDSSSATPIRLARFPAGIYRYAITPSGKRVIGEFQREGNRTTIQVWDIVDGQLKTVIRETDGKRAAIAPSGELMAFARSADGIMELYRIVRDKLERRYEFPGPEGVQPSGNNSKCCVHFLSDSRLLTLADDGTPNSSGNPCLWKLADEEPKLLAIEKSIRGRFVAVSSDGRRICLNAENAVYVCDVGDTELTKRFDLSNFEEQESNVCDVAFLPDGKTLITAHLNTAVRLWDVAGSDIIERDPLPVRQSIGQIDISADGQFLAAINGPGRLGMWHLSGTGILPMDQSQKAVIGALRFSGDGKQLMMGGSPPLLLQRTADDWKATFKLSSISNGYSLTFAPDGRSIAVSLPEELALYHLKEGMAVKISAVPKHSAREKLLFANGGRTLICAAAQEKGGLTIWDVSDEGLTKREEQSPGIPWDADVSPNGQVLAVGTTLTGIHLWTLRDGRPTLPQHFDSGTQYDSVAFSPTGKLLASTGQGQDTVIIWDVATGARVHVMPYPLWAQSIRFAPDGRHVIVSHYNGTIYVLRLPKELWQKESPPTNGT